MQITINTTDGRAELEAVKTLIDALLGETPAEKPVAKPAEEKPVAPKPVAPKPKAAPKPEPEPEPEDDDPLGMLGETEEVKEYTQQDALKAASALMSKGASNVVREALNEIGVKRVSELKPKQIATFMGLLPAPAPEDD